MDNDDPTNDTTYHSPNFDAKGGVADTGVNPDIMVTNPNFGGGACASVVEAGAVEPTRSITDNPNF